MIVADFGHVGDGGTHFNMIWPSEIPYRADLAEALRVAVYEIVARHGGSFSAEHGVGPFNEHFYRRYVPARSASWKHGSQPCWTRPRRRR